MGVDIEGKLRLAIGTMKDHASIGKAVIYNQGFSDIEIAIVRATSHDNGLVDDERMHEILFLVSNSPGSIPFLAERISRRLVRTRDHVVALKTLLLIHRLLRGGNRSFEQQLRLAHVSGHLQMNTNSWFLYKNLNSSSVCFLSKYAAYLEERVGWVINQAGKLEPALSHSRSTQSIDAIFLKLPKCLSFIDRVLDCAPIFDALRYEKISSSNTAQATAAISSILKESFQVYKTYSEGIATLVDMFFDLTNQARALACQILKRASLQTRELQEFYDKCKRIMGNKILEYPFVQIITTDHVAALEQCTLDYKFEYGSSKLRKPSQPNEDGEVKGSSNSYVVASLFSCGLETKISKVWVIFDEDEHEK